MCVCVCVRERERERESQLCLTLHNAMNYSPQVPLSMGFFQQEYWNGWPFPLPGDLSDPGIEPMSPASPALAGGFFTTAPPGKVWSLGRLKYRVSGKTIHRICGRFIVTYSPLLLRL